MSGSDSESVVRTIPQPAEKIFDLLADPAMHKVIDGSGTVRDAKGGSERLVLGSSFGMSMKMGVPYSMVNTVIEYEPNRKIAWQTRPPGVFAKLGGGRIWRYELEPTENGTKVTETWDISQEVVKAFVTPIRKRTITSMADTLANIEQLLGKG